MGDTERHMQILCVSPEVLITEEQEITLYNNGFVVLRCRPGDVVAMDVAPLVNGGAMFRAALEAIKAHGCAAVRTDFAERLIDAMLAARAGREGA